MYVFLSSSILGDSVELQTFRRHYSELVKGIQSPAEFADLLYSRGMINSEVRERVGLLVYTVSEKNRIYLKAVEQAIHTNPKNLSAFMDILTNEPAYKQLHIHLSNTYCELRCYRNHRGSLHSTDRSSNGFSNNCKSSSDIRDSLLTCPHTITPLPQKLTVRGPSIRCATVKVVFGPDRTPQGCDQWYTLPVLVINSSSGTPLNCIVALKGDKPVPFQGTMVCYLLLNIHLIEDEKSQESTQPPTLPTHHIERRSEYTANGRATYRICFYTETSYLISVGVYCVQDEEGVECVGYNVDQYTAVIRAVRIVERNAFKRPPLIKFEGPLMSKRFQRLMAVCSKLHYKGRLKELSTIVSRIASSDIANLDIRLYMSIENLMSYYSYDVAQGEELFKKCQALDCQNGSLLQAYVMLSLANSYSHNRENEKALECIRYSRSVCCVATPSYLTSLIFYVEARILIRQHEGNITPCVKKMALELFDRAIADSYYGVGWERYTLYLSHIIKALFCLNERTDYDFHPTSSYIPTAEDKLIAERHLGAVPVDELHEICWYAISYYIALSDLNRLRGDTATARQHAEMAKQMLYKQVDMEETASLYKKVFGKAINSRIEYLEADPIDKILEEYEHM